MCPNQGGRSSSPQDCIVLRLLLPPLNWEVLQLLEDRVRENVKTDRLPRESVKSLLLENLKIRLDKALGNQIQLWCCPCYEQEVGHGDVQRCPQISVPL